MGGSLGPPTFTGGQSCPVCAPAFPTPTSPVSLVSAPASWSFQPGVKASELQAAILSTECVLCVCAHVHVVCAHMGCTCDVCAHGCVHAMCAHVLCVHMSMWCARTWGGHVMCACVCVCVPCVHMGVFFCVCV